MIHFPASGVSVSLWTILVIGIAIGFMAGTIGVGGFLGVPAMIYIFGVPTVVAAGTELFLAMFMGAWGALNYALEGMVDMRLTLLLYGGSLVGIHMGVIGTTVCKELYIRLITAVLILLCCVSRVFAMPQYVNDLGLFHFSAGTMQIFDIASKIFLFGSGIVATSMIYYWIIKAHIKKLKLARGYI